MGFSLYLPVERVRWLQMNPALHRTPGRQFHQNTVNTWRAKKDYPADLPGTSDHPFHV
jgi:hypothetical protein